MYTQLQWTDEDVVKLCGAIATGKLVKLEQLNLGEQPDWRRRRRRARGGGGQAAAAQEASAATRLATPALPRSRRWWTSCRSSRHKQLRLATPALPRPGKLPQLK